MVQIRKQPDGASRQAVCVLIGAILGSGIAINQIFADFHWAGQIPWATGVSYTIGGAFVGMILSAIMVAGVSEEESKTPALSSELVGVAHERFEPHTAPANPHIHERDQLEAEQQPKAAVEPDAIMP